MRNPYVAVNIVTTLINMRDPEITTYDSSIPTMSNVEEMVDGLTFQYLLEAYRKDDQLHYTAATYAPY